MSVTFGFYNSINKDRVYNADQVSRIFDGVISDGVYQGIPEAGDFLKVRAGSGMQVIVGPGRAWFNHTWTYNDGDLPLTIKQAPIAGGRIDAIVLVVNREDSARQNTIKVIEGIPSDNPVKPTLTDTDYLFHHVLSYVTVNYGTTEITDAMIENVVGTDQTPFVAGVVRQISTSDLISQWWAQWNAWYSEKTKTINNQWNDLRNHYTASFEELLVAFTKLVDDSEEEWETIKDRYTTAFQQLLDLFTQWTDTSEADFYTWFSNLQNELNEHQAAHLQEEINDLKRILYKENNNLLSKIIYDVDGGIKSIVSSRPGYQKTLSFNQNGDIFSIRREVITNSVRYLDVVNYDKANGTITETYTTSDGFEQSRTSTVTYDDYGIINAIETIGDDYFRSLTFEDDGNTAKVVETRSDTEESYTDTIYYDGDDTITESYKGQTSIVTKGRSDDISRIETTGTDYSRDLSFEYMDKYKNTYQISDGKLEDGEYHVRTVLYNASANTILEKYM